MYQKLAASIRRCRRIFVLTGAGLSAPSNIPTFRGKNGMWTQSAANGMDPTELLTKATFDLDAKVIWNWLIDFRQVIAAAKPNEGHKAILKLQEHCKTKEIDFTLVTQNIDNFHSQLIRDSSILKPDLTSKEGTGKYGFTEGVIEIHGNAYYMRCDNERCHGLFDIPRTLSQDSVPICKKCGKEMRPHALMFDEKYRDDYYQSIKVANLAKRSDCMLIVGSELKTYLPQKIVYDHVHKNRLTIEINPRQVINWDGPNVSNIEESCEKSLPALVHEIMQD